MNEQEIRAIVRDEPKAYKRVGTPEYMAWTSMRSRCLSKRHVAYARYGGRGITICAEWGTYAAFRRDMGARPPKDHSLDRIDNNKGYSPDNCRWATREEQQANTCRSRLVTAFGETKTVRHWARSASVCASSLLDRLNRGIDPVTAMTMPRVFPRIVGSQHRNAKLNEELVRQMKLELASGMRVGKAAKKYGVSQPTVSEIKSGKKWSHVAV